MSPHGVIFVIVSIFACTFALPSFVSTQRVNKHDKRVFENSVENIGTESWDYLLFVNQWPETFCKYFNATHRRPRSEQKCYIPSDVTTWTIHGTWPTKTGTEGPTGCNNTWQFDLSKVKDLVPEMNKTWPGLVTGEAYWGFWSHEWDKHGTCAASLPILYGEHNYFEQTLQLKQKYNVDDILRSSGITPSSTAKYSREQIFEAVKNGTGGMPDLQCYQEKTSSGFQQYLQEIRMCLDKSLKAFDCPVSLLMHLTSAYESPCSSMAPIALPPTMHTVL